MRKAGVHFLAGTDLLSTTEALRTAITEPVLLMGLERHFGTVEPGKAADLLILDGDPTKNIHNAQRIFAVIVGGRLFAREALDTLRARVEKCIAEDSGGTQPLR
jgi:imidazolonepropionase-like amidohydrolase